MTVTYVLTTDIGMVRLKIGDSTGATFSDEEIQAFLDLELGVLRASAAALETMAATAGLNTKAIQVMQLKVDNSKKGANLLALAQLYRSQADALDGGLFDWAEFIDEPFAAREKLEKDLLRGLV